jgi:hypothetical protein
MRETPGESRVCERQGVSVKRSSTIPLAASRYCQVPSASPVRQGNAPVFRQLVITAQREVKLENGEASLRRRISAHSRSALTTARETRRARITTR